MPRSQPPPAEQRASERVAPVWWVDCQSDDTFLYALITNIAELGVFVRTHEPLSVGTLVTLRFSPAHDSTFAMQGEVQWQNRIHAFGENLNPGMGIRFLELQLEERERLVAAIRTIVYLRRDPTGYTCN